MSGQACGQCSAGPGEPCEPYYCTCYDCIKQQEDEDAEEARLDERGRIAEYLRSESVRITNTHSRTSDVVAEALINVARELLHGCHEDGRA